MLGEMHRPYEIYTTICMDQKGNTIDDYGLRAAAAAAEAEAVEVEAAGRTGPCSSGGGGGGGG
jgi:hypothetical protein